MKDLTLAVRLLTRRPAFAFVVIGTLALGIGATSTMFSVVNGVLIKPLPYHEPDRLIWMWGAFRLNDSAAVSPPDFLDYRSGADLVESMGAMAIAPSGVTVATSEGPIRLRSSRMSSGMLPTLGVQLALGRDFTPGEEMSAGVDPIILSYSLWQQRFGGDRSALGRALTIDGRARTIVGSMPPGFTLPYDPFIRLTEAVDLYAPLRFDTPNARVRRFHNLRVIGRLRTGASPHAAQTQMDAIARQLESAYPENETWRLRLVPLRQRLVGDVQQVLLVLMAAVVLVLLIACANVAGLLLARAASRQNEIALRNALGASRGRVVRQLLIEGAVLAIAGCAVGLALAYGALAVIKSNAPSGVPRLQSVSIDPQVMLFTLLVGLGTALLLALAPALYSSRHSTPAALREGLRATGTTSAARVRSLLVSAQVGLSVMLLIGAGLLARSYQRLQAVDPGFSPEGVLMAQLSLPTNRYEGPEAMGRFFSALLDQLNAAVDVEAAALTTLPPLLGGNDTSLHREGRPPASDAARQFAQTRWVQGRYFAALGIPIVAGRPFDDTRDTEQSPPVAVVSRALADRFFEGENPIGARIVIDVGRPLTAEIVGVAGDTRLFGQSVDAPDTLYLSSRQDPGPFMHLVVRTRQDAGRFAPLLRESVASLDSTLAVERVHTMEAALAQSVAEPRFRTGLILAFSGVAVLLTLVGLYGTVAYAVNQRTREIGIRLALGAARSGVIGMVLRQGAVLVVIGTLAGLAGALAASRLLAEMLFQVTPRDPVVFVVVPLLLALVALSAILAPARRASKVDPVIALRAE